MADTEDFSVQSKKTEWVGSKETYYNVAPEFGEPFYSNIDGNPEPSWMNNPGVCRD
jgi:hypothetical protein